MADLGHSNKYTAGQRRGRRPASTALPRTNRPRSPHSPTPGQRPLSLPSGPRPRRSYLSSGKAIPPAASQPGADSPSLRLLPSAPSQQAAPARQAAPQPSPTLPQRRSRRPQISEYAAAFGGRRRLNRAPIAPQSSAISPSPGGSLARSRRSPQLTPVPASPRRAEAPTRPPRRLRRRAAKKPSRLLYAVRLLILGLGIAAIAGTLLSALNPARNLTASNAVLDPGESSTTDASQPTADAPGAPGTLGSGLMVGSELSPLKTELSEAIAAYPQLRGRVAILDLDNGGYADISSQTTVAAASTIKVPVLVAFLQAVEAGDIALNDTVTMQAADVAEGSGSMQYEPVGTTYTALEAADMMITISDNTATNILIRRLGGMVAVNQRFAQWGLSQTTLAQPLPDLEGQNKTTAMELATLVAAVSNGELLSPRSRDLMFEIMRNTVTDTLLPQGIPLDATIAHKTGDIGTVLGDVGLIDTPEGRRYVIAVMVERPFNDEQAADLARTLSEITYDGISSETGSEAAESQPPVEGLNQD
ncbi:MAG: serine hydrolase [Cyanobacteria bacterium P01_A01_bin.135]